MVYEEETGKISTTEKEHGAEVKWSIPNFSSLSAQDNAWYCSPPFSIDGHDCRLDISTNGASWRNTSGIIHLQICKISSSSGATDLLHFSVALQNVNGERECEQKSSGRFWRRWDNHVSPPSISREELLRRRRELLPSDVLTVVLTVSWEPPATSARVTPTAECRHCKKSFSADSLLSHQRKCEQRPVSCPDCRKTVPLEKFLSEDHECRKENAPGNSSNVECCVCKEKHDSDSIASHQERCMQRTIQCPGCLDEVLLREWIDGHQCQKERTGGYDCTSLCPLPLYIDKMVQDFKELFLNQEASDVTLNVQGRAFPAHKAILAARSPVLASAFRHEMKEKETNTIEIEDCDPFSFSDFLSFLYCGSVSTITTENVFSLFKTADKYVVQDLRSHCLAFMKENLSVNTFVDTVIVALQHGEKDLIPLVADFFAKNQLDIIMTVKWQSFLVANPIQSNEIVIKALKSSKK